MKKLSFIIFVSISVYAYSAKNESSRKFFKESSHYHENGKLKQQGFYHSGIKNGEWKEWDQNGRLIGTSEYTDGRKDGIWKVFDQKGNVRVEMNFKNNQKTGTWLWRNENGKIIRTEKY